jgi:hypothetical protein
MGCLCSKRMKSNESSISFVQPSTFNAILKEKSAIQITTTDSNPLKDKVINIDKGYSLLVSPKPEQLKLHAWLRKRGHLVRSWKKRYFVLASNSLQYYKNSSSNPPYGEKLCGEVYLRGAVMEIKKSSKDKTTIIEITGRKGKVKSYPRLNGP